MFLELKTGRFEPADQQRRILVNINHIAAIREPRESSNCGCYLYLKQSATEQSLPIIEDYETVVRHWKEAYHAGL